METMFFSANTGGFYASKIHGDNIPSDAVEITNEQYRALICGQSEGWCIGHDENGNPVLQNQPPATIKQQTLAEIAVLEATVGARRIREAVLGIDGGWLKSLNDQVAELRKRLQ